MNLLTRFPLRLTIPLFLLLLALLAEGYTMKYNLRLADTEEESKAVALVTREMTQLQDSINYRLRKQELDRIQSVIAQRGANPNITVVALVDDAGIIIGSTSLKHVGVPIRQALPDVDAAFMKEAGATLAGRVALSDDRRLISAYFPIILGTRVGEIRPHRVGILYLCYDVASAKAIRRHDLEHQALVMAGFYAGCFLLLGLFLHQVFTRRVGRLVFAARRFAAGDCSVQTGLEGKDELAQIGEAFDNMLRKILFERGSLRESEERFRLLADNSSDVIYRMSLPDGRYEYVSPASAALFGYAPEEFYNSPMLIRQVIHPDWQGYFVEQWEKLLSGHMPPSYEYQIIDRAGETRWICQRNTQIRDASGRPIAIQGIVTDSTERKQAEEALRRSEERYRLVFENSPVSIWEEDFSGVKALFDGLKKEGVTDIQAYFTQHPETIHQCADLAKIVDVNRAALALHAAANKEELLAGLVNTFTPESLDTFRQELVCLWNAGTEMTGDAVVKTLAGDHRNVTVQLSVCPGYEGTLSKVIVSLIDITERRRAEEALRESEWRYREIFDTVLDGLYLLEVTEDGRFRTVEVNPALERLTGVPRSFSVGKTQEETVPPEVAAIVNAKYRHCVAAGHPIEEEAELDLPAGRRYFHSTLIPTRALSGKIHSIIGISRDITELKQVEQERQANLRFFESMDRVNRALQGVRDLDSMASDVLDVVLSIFDCDRAFLMYPCDPEAATWQVPAERNKPDYPGAHAQGLEIPMDADVARTIRELLATDRPVKFGPETGHPLPEDVAQKFGFRSFMSIAIYPKVGKPWQFGIHQCSYARIWTPEEELILTETGRRLADGISSLLSFRELRESEARSRLIVDTATEGIWVLGPDTMTTFVNAKMAEMLGYSSEEMDGRPLTDFMVEEDVPDHLTRMENRRRGLSESYERRFRHKCGQLVWTNVSATPIVDDELHFGGSFGMFTDITEHKRAEQEILQAKEELEQKVRERTADLEGKNTEIRTNQSALMNIVEDLNEKAAELASANAKLQELDRLKAMFIASMSHELRTPLNSIIGFSSIMLNEWTGPLTAEQKENLASVLRSGKHLLSLINDVIDVSKIEAGKIESVTEDFDASDLVREAVETLKKDIESKRLELKVRAPRQVLHADRRRILQCLLNLLSNAVKYTDAGMIEVCADKSDDGVSFEFSVRDTGVGIKEADMGKLFSPFMRFVSPQRAVVPGTGLGLYLTKKLARDILRGDIAVNSTSGTGSRFTLRVPLAGHETREHSDPDRTEQL